MLKSSVVKFKDYFYCEQCEIHFIKMQNFTVYEGKERKELNWPMLLKLGLSTDSSVFIHRAAADQPV